MNYTNLRPLFSMVGLTFAALALLFLAGCSTTPDNRQPDPAQTAVEKLPSNVKHEIDATKIKSDALPQQEHMGGAVKETALRYKGALPVAYDDQGNPTAWVIYNALEATQATAREGDLSLQSTINKDGTKVISFTTGDGSQDGETSRALAQQATQQRQSDVQGVVTVVGPGGAVSGQEAVDAPEINDQNQRTKRAEIGAELGEKALDKVPSPPNVGTLLGE